MMQMQIQDDPTPLSTILEQLKTDYPPYYRAWKSMITSYGSDSVCEKWRGTLGLATFIQDTSTLDDSPTILPNVRQRLKRKVQSFQFDKDNVYWKVPAAVTRRAPRNTLGSNNTAVLPSVPQVTHSAAVQSISALKAKYNTTELLEARMEELFNLSMAGNITTEQSAELDVLGKLLAGDEVPVPPASKFEDI